MIFWIAFICVLLFGFTLSLIMKDSRPFVLSTFLALSMGFAKFVLSGGIK